MIESAPITGNEPLQDDGSPRTALVNFYRAFDARDLAGLQAVWADGSAGLEPSMSNPIGGLRRGWRDIEAAYRSLFEGQARVIVEFYDYAMQERESWCLFVGRERGFCVAPDSRLELAIRTSRLFTLIGGQWRQIHHHGSFERGSMLSAYQQAVLGTAQ